MSDTNITDKHRVVFEALTSGQYSNFALFSCFVNGEPAAAIVAIVTENSIGGVVEEVIVKPLFVSVTPSMVLTSHDGEEAKE